MAPDTLLTRRPNCVSKMKVRRKGTGSSKSCTCTRWRGVGDENEVELKQSFSKLSILSRIRFYIDKVYPCTHLLAHVRAYKRVFLFAKDDYFSPPPLLSNVIIIFSIRKFSREIEIIYQQYNASPSIILLSDGYSVFFTASFSVASHKFVIFRSTTPEYSQWNIVVVHPCAYIVAYILCS